MANAARWTRVQFLSNAQCQMSGGGNSFSLAVEIKFAHNLNEF